MKIIGHYSVNLLEPQKRQWEGAQVPQGVSIESECKRWKVHQFKEKTQIDAEQTDDTLPNVPLNLPIFKTPDEPAKG